ncbi:YbgA family protein [Alkalilimnicola sp. S0819]|uniref:YbgA family protein n=1 Tax=Alkalilimnicola sp. S0819 TaxID=2613922 RepID=UPI0012624119|nr:DUF523 and DUF1722 domain-containing protein [Alkalilimnicola sp. S0819]KAB7619532.1 DUF1722 domain-containing protein [Alkalilimnicola sp. S0819]MPQ17639.1 DUF1722 domain-containing protein [Alkalilimnicola sp. S0819]
MNQASVAPPLPEQPIRLGVSSCLLGEQVRFDSGHKRSPFIADVLATYFEFVPVCPEVAIGLSIPRPPIRLEGDPEHPRAVGARDASFDVSERLRDFGRRMSRELPSISGYIFKSKSPSCGMERVKVYGEKGMPAKLGRGLYAAEIMAANPLLPCEEEGRLNDPVLRENFLGRVYAYRRWQELLAKGLSAEALVRFHSRHKYLLMAHGKERLRALGRLIARAGSLPLEELAGQYGALFMDTLAYRATRRRHTDVLFHLFGYLKRELDAEGKAEMVELIHDYREGRVPLIVPITLLRHHFRRHPSAYVAEQFYLHWAPAGLSLWNSI